MSSQWTCVGENPDPHNGLSQRNLHLDNAHRTEQEDSITDSGLTTQSSPLESNAQFVAIHDLTLTSGNTLEVDQPEDNLFSVIREDPDIDTMPYPYPRYNEGTDVEVYVHAFLTTW